MDNFRNEVIDTIDSFGGIETCVLETAVSVYECLSHEFDKVYSIMESNEESIDSSFGLFQEESIIDHATGKHTADGMFKKILLFVPRLIGGIVRAIAGVFTKDYKKETDKDYKNAQYTITHGTSDQLSKIANTVNAGTDGQITFDPKTKKFTLGEKFRHIKNKIIILTGSTVLLNKLRQACTSKNIPYKNLAKDLADIFNKNKEVDNDTITYTLESMKQLMDDGFATSLTMKAVCEELSTVLTNKIQSDLAGGKDPQKLADAKDLLDKLGQMSGYVAGVTGFGAIGRKILGLFGRPIALHAKNTEMHDEIADLKRQEKMLEAQIKTNKADAKMKRKLQAKLDKLKTKIYYSQQELDDSRDEVKDVDEYVDREKNDMTPKKYI